MLVCTGEKMDHLELRNLQSLVDQQLQRDRHAKQNQAKHLESVLKIAGGSLKKNQLKSPVEPISADLAEQQYPTVGVLKPLVPWKNKESASLSSNASTLKYTMKKRHHKPRKLVAINTNSSPGHGIYRSMDVVKISSGSSLGSISSDMTPATEVSEHLVQNVTRVFKEMFGSRRDQQKEEESHHVYVSRIQTPPQLINDDLTAYRSRDLFNEIAEDLNSISNVSMTSSTFSLDSSIKSLSSKSATVLTDLQSAYSIENQNFSSLALFVEARYLELKEKEKSTGNKPTHCKAAVIGDLVLTLTRAMGRYSQLMEPLLWELLNCIFVNFAAVETRLTHDKLVHELQNMPVFFDKYFECLSRLEDAEIELGVLQKGISMKEIVKKFQTVRLAFDKSAGFVRDACFRVWKTYAYQWKQKRSKAKLMALRYRMTVWKLHMQQKHLDYLGDYSNNIEAKINKCIKYYEESMMKKKGYVYRAESSFKVLIPTDERSYSMKKYLQRLSKYVSDKLDPIKYDMEDPVVPLPSSAKGPQYPAAPFFSNQHLLTRGTSKRMDTRGPSLRHINAQSDLTTLSEDAPSADEGDDSSSVDSKGSQAPLVRRGSKVMRRPSPLQSQLSHVDIATILDLVGSNRDSDAASGARWHNLKLSANLCHEQMTQTPDEWMAEISEPAVDPEEFERRKLAHHKPHAKDEDGDDMSINTLTGSSSNIGDPASAKYQMNIDVAHHLISFIYESRIFDALKDPSMLEFNREEPFLEYIKKLFLTRYRIRRLANKFFRGLMSCCLREGSNYRRLDLFGQLCGLSLVHKMGQTYDPKRCGFFFHILNHLFRDDVDSMVATFHTNLINRQLVLDHLPQIYSAVEKYEDDLYEAIMFEIIDLPCMEITSIEKEFKVDVDEAFAIMMEYYDVELNERESHKIKLRREQIAHKKFARSNRETPHHSPPHTSHAGSNAIYASSTRSHTPHGAVINPEHVQHPHGHLQQHFQPHNTQKLHFM